MITVPILFSDSLRGGQISNSNILIFLHQDIVFSTSESLKEIVEAVESLDNCIVGIAGATHGKRAKIRDKYWTAQTLDECCIAMPRAVWERYRFNEELCNGWHLYVVELCLRAQNELTIASGEFGIRHLSIGNVDEAYMHKLKELLVRYREQKWIATTCKSLPTNLAVYYGYYFIWKIKKELLGNFPLVHRLKQVFHQRLD